MVFRGLRGSGLVLPEAEVYLKERVPVQAHDKKSKRTMKY